MFWYVKKAWGKRDQAFIGCGALKMLWHFLNVGCQTFTRKGLKHLSCILWWFWWWINQNFLEWYFANFSYSKWLLWPFSNWTECDEFQMVKLRQTAPKLEFNNNLKLFPHMETCSVSSFLLSSMEIQIAEFSLETAQRNINSVFWSHVWALFTICVFAVLYFIELIEHNELLPVG